MPALPSKPPLVAGQLHCPLPYARDRREMRPWQERKQQPLQDTVLRAFPRRSGNSVESSKGPSLDHRTCPESVSYTHLRAHETRHDLVCRLLLEKKKKKKTKKI